MRMVEWDRGKEWERGIAGNGRVERKTDRQTERERENESKQERGVWEIGE